MTETQDLMRILLPLAALCWLAFVGCDDDKESNHDFIIKRVEHVDGVAAPIHW